MPNLKTSQFLEKQSIYTRTQLTSRFQITDKTINNGIFIPSGHDSIWLFITIEKTKDRVQYVDFLDGPVLKMGSQKQGRLDQRLRDHESSGFEILVFLRQHKSEHPGYGFRYEGTFKHVYDTGEPPADFIFRRVD